MNLLRRIAKLYLAYSETLISVMLLFDLQSLQILGKVWKESGKKQFLPPLICS